LETLLINDRFPAEYAVGNPIVLGTVEKYRFMEVIGKKCWVLLTTGETGTLVKEQITLTHVYIFNPNRVTIEFAVNLYYKETYSNGPYNFFIRSKASKCIEIKQLLSLRRNYAVVINANMEVIVGHRTEESAQ